MIRRILALARHNVHSVLRAPFTWTGVGLVPALPLVGGLATWVQEGAPRFQGGLLTLGALLGAIFVLRSGLVEHRVRGLQDVLRSGYVTPVEHVAAAVASLLALLLLLAAWVAAVGAILSGGDMGSGAWAGWLFLLRVGVLLPFVLATELLADVRTPLVLPGAFLLAALVMVALFVGAEAAVSLAGANVDRAFPWVSTGPLLVRAGVSMGVGFAALLVWTRLRSPRPPAG